MLVKDDMKKIDIIKNCNNKYFQLTGQSPTHSFWSFLDACGIEPNEKTLIKFYNEMEEYIDEEVKND
jgi:hypothetical protein